MNPPLNYELHSIYKRFAIYNNKGTLDQLDYGTVWSGFTDNAITSNVDELSANTLKELKVLITQYEHDRKEHQLHMRKKIIERQQ